MYVANNLLYAFVLKTKAIADVLVIAIGFVLRLIVGAIAIGVTPSSWLLVCGFSLALLLGFGKRRMELMTSEEYTVRVEMRKTLTIYTPQKLDSLMSICASVSLMWFML